MKYGLNPRSPAIFHNITLLSSQYRYSTVPCVASSWVHYLEAVPGVCLPWCLSGPLPALPGLLSALPALPGQFPGLPALPGQLPGLPAPGRWCVLWVYTEGVQGGVGRGGKLEEGELGGRLYFINRERIHLYCHNWGRYGAVHYSIRQRRTWIGLTWAAKGIISHMMNYQKDKETDRHTHS